jgi:hypothetical protein
LDLSLKSISSIWLVEMATGLQIYLYDLGHHSTECFSEIHVAKQAMYNVVNVRLHEIIILCSKSYSELAIKIFDYISRIFVMLFIYFIRNITHAISGNLQQSARMNENQRRSTTTSGDRRQSPSLTSNVNSFYSLKLP